LEEFFTMGFFDKVTINITSCTELEDEKMEKRKNRKILQKEMIKL